jgi:hypothetical protein
MNAYQELQSSGILWPDRPPAPLYQPFQEAPQRPEPRQRAATLEGFERQMAAFASQHEAVLNDVRKHYVLPADSSVVNFLTEHRTIPQILLEAAPQLKTCFGAEAVFSLRAPIDEAGSRTLYAVAMWPGKLQHAREALARFDNAWWIARSRQASGYLVFTYELT